MQLRELTVIKSDGRRVPFDRDKLARSIRIALRKRPVQEERIERIVNGIVRQLEASGETDIPSKQIGELVMETLKEVDAGRLCPLRQRLSRLPRGQGFRGLPRVSSTALHERRWTTQPTCAPRSRWRGAGLGSVWPNPSVGCVIVRDGRVVGRAVTAPGGRPHAETQALAMAGEAARGATAYVTLEPCCHHGQTPPCTDALIAAGDRARRDRRRATPTRASTAAASPGCARPGSR